jgi:hypothetical protein
MKGSPKSGKWKEHTLENAATPAEIIGFRIWYADIARSRGWTQTSLPTAPETIHDRFLNFLADERSYERLVDIGRTKIMEMLKITDKKPVTPEQAAEQAALYAAFMAKRQEIIDMMRPREVKPPNVPIQR